MTMAKRMHIQPFLYIGLAIASIALVPALSARKVTTKVDVKALKATRISEDETAMSGSRRTPLSGDSAKAAVRMYGYDKPFAATKESVFLENKSETDTVDSLRVRILYQSLNGDGLHTRDVTFRCNTAPGASERLYFSTWDATHTFYYYRTPPTRKQGLTPYKVSLLPLRVYVH